jgi:hypothetical protein
MTVAAADHETDNVADSLVCEVVKPCALAK